MNRKVYWIFLYLITILSLSLAVCSKKVDLTTEDLDELAGMILEGLNSKVVTNPEVKVAVDIPPIIDGEAVEKELTEITLNWSVKKFDTVAEGVESKPLTCDTANDCQAPNCWLISRDLTKPASYMLENIVLDTIDEEKFEYDSMWIDEDGTHAYQDFETVGGTDTAYSRVTVELSKVDECEISCQIVELSDSSAMEILNSDDSTNLSDRVIIEEEFEYCERDGGETTVCIIEVQPAFLLRINEDDFSWMQTVRYFTDLKSFQDYTAGLEDSTITMERIEVDSVSQDDE